MKKVITVIFLTFLIFSLALTSAQEDTTITPSSEPTVTNPALATNPNSPIDANQQKFENIQENIDKIPIDDQGNIDQDKVDQGFQLAKTKAELRIQAINTWLQTNASWLRFIFKIVPEISWLFFINLYLLIVGIVYLILNAQRTWAFIGAFETGDYFDTESKMRIFGSLVFLIAWALNLFITLSQIIVNSIAFFWQTVLPYTIIVAVLLVIVFSIIILAVAWLGPGWIVAIMNFLVRLTGRKIATDHAHHIINKVEEKLEEVQKEKEVLQATTRGLKGSGFTQAA
ncbi:MAG: hypothetical protein ACI83O_000653 [Patescibacteria group bacterium]|jgi:hypothetical protein